MSSDVDQAYELGYERGLADAASRQSLSKALFDALDTLVKVVADGVLYEDGGRWYIGIHGDEDVTDLVGDAIRDAKTALASNAEHQRRL